LDLHKETHCHSVTPGGIVVIVERLTQENEPRTIKMVQEERVCWILDEEMLQILSG